MLKVREIDGAVKGRFSDGDPDYDFVDATKVSDYWYNAVQFELVNLVEFTGQKLDENNEVQVISAIRKLSGFDSIINSDYFVGKSEDEKKKMNQIGFFEKLTDLSKVLKEGANIKVEKASDYKIDGAIEINKPNVTLQFSSNFALENGGDVEKPAFNIYGDGVQLIDVRMRGFKYPIHVKINEIIHGSTGVFVADRCLGIKAERLFTKESTVKHTLVQLSSSVVI